MRIRKVRTSKREGRTFKLNHKLEQIQQWDRAPEHTLLPTVQYSAKNCRLRIKATGSSPSYADF